MAKSRLVVSETPLEPASELTPDNSDITVTAPPEEHLSDADKQALKEAIQARQTAALQAQFAELTYKSFMQDLFLRNGMTLQDGLDESGRIVRNANAKA